MPVPNPASQQISHLPRIRPVFLALILIVSGIMLEEIVQPRPVLAFGAAIGAVVISLLCHRKRALMGGFLCLSLLLAALGRTAEVLQPSPNDISRWQNSPSQWVLGRVVSAPSPKPYRSIAFDLAVTHVFDFQTTHPASGSVHVTVRGIPPKGAPRIGDILWLRGRMTEPPSASNPGSFDYRKHLARQGIFSLMTVKQPADLYPLRQNISSPVDGIRQVGRQAVLITTKSHLNPDDAALLNGLLLSVRDRLPAAVEEAFARTGTVHLLSVSGSHLTAVVIFLVWVGRLLTAPRPMANVACLLFVWALALMAESGSAAIRAAVMATVVLLAPLVRRRAEPLHSVALAGCLLLLWQPGALYNAGFQLSFVVTGALLLWVPPLFRLFIPWQPGMNRWQTVTRFVVGALLAGIVAETASAPLVAYHFHRFSLIGPLANIVIGPLAQLTLIAGFGTISLSWLPEAITGLLWMVISVLIAVFRGVTLSLAELPFAAFSVAAPPVGLLVSYYILGGGSGLVAHRRILRKTLLASPPDPSV
ncbi:MAG: ComEC/Rec2 family competence protein [Armatimonadaceae bacterium]